MSWRMAEMCANCPFQSKGPGLRLRRSLRRGRWEEILRALASDQYFPCHKTVEYDDHDEVGEAMPGGGAKAKVCAGALAWQEKRGLSSNYQRVCERLEAARKPRKETE